MLYLILGQHSEAGVSLTVRMSWIQTYQLVGSFVYGVCMFSLARMGFPPPPKDMQVELIGAHWCDCECGWLSVCVTCVCTQPVLHIILNKCVNSRI